MITRLLFSVLSFLLAWQPAASVHHTLPLNQFAYCPTQLIRKMHCADCADWTLGGVYDPPSKASTQVVVVSDEEEDEILVGFRGTLLTIPQWTSNLEIKFEKWIEGSVHEGFHQRYLEILSPALTYIRNARKRLPHADLIITGHSMGGAVATLFASKLVDMNEPALTPNAVYTYGSPRVGDKTFSKFVDGQLGGKLVRVMNEWDMVTDLPPTAFGYRHTGVLMVCQTATSNCEKRDRMSENPGGILKALQRATKTANNVDKCHLTYMDHRLGTGKYDCDIK